MSRRLWAPGKVLIPALLLAAMTLGGCQRFVRWLEGEPPSSRAYRTANELFDDERYEEAAVAFRAWIADYHDKQDVMRPFVYYKLGECYRLRRNYERATAAYTTLIKESADSPDEAIKDLVGLARLRLADITPKTRSERPEGAPGK